MRIACLAATDQLGGAEIALLEMIRSVRRHRPEWSFAVILPGTGPFHDACVRDGIGCEVLPLPAALARLGEAAMAKEPWPSARLAAATQLLPAAPRIPSHVNQLKRTLRRINPSVIHSHGVKAHILGALCTERTPLIWHLHEYVSGRPVSLRLLRLLAHRCAAIVANSKSVASDAQEALGTVGAIHAIHNAVALDRFDPHGDVIDLDRLSGLGRPSEPIVRVGLLSTFGRWKGHETFLRALAELSPGLSVRGYVIGDPLYRTAGSQYTRAALEDLASSLGLGTRVGFTGFQRADRALRSLDIVVHASTEPEPFGLVIAEAMACGKPLVTTGLGGASEIVSDGVDALVTRPGDPRALAAAIRRLAINPILREGLGRRARESAMVRFNPERLAASLITLYEHCASQRRSQRPRDDGKQAKNPERAAPSFECR